jgi:hypothetical protein
MKYKYIVGLLVALSFNSGFAAEVATDNYQEIYEAFTRGGAANINAALKNNPNFNHNADADTIRSSATGLALRTAVIGLGFAELQTLVEANEANHTFFKTSLGMSLLYGWVLNQFADAVTPYYIGRYFSFDKMFQGLANRADVDANVKTFLQSAFTRGLAAVEADRWAFYGHMLYLPYAIEKVRATVPVAPAAPTMDAIIAGARRSADEARTEAANLARAPGRAVHLIDETTLGDPQDDSDDSNFVGLQIFTIQNPELCNDILAIKLEIFHSLPADTDADTFTFMGSSVSAHMLAFRAAIEAADAEHAWVC